MAEIARLAVDPALPPGDAWADIARQSAAWLAEAGVALRDAVVILPLAQHLGPARQAFGALGGWLPRTETVRTLAASAGAPAPRPAEAISFDAAQDRLVARRMLQAQAWARDWRRADPQGFDQTVGRFVETAHRLAQRSAAIAPARRLAWKARARSLFEEGDEPGGVERLLARVAFEWVCASEPWPTDAAFAVRPGAWVVLQAGGEPALALALMEAASEGVPCLLLQADPVPDQALQALPAAAKVECGPCADFEDEAAHAAAQVLSMLQQGLQPLALVSQDRLLVRRAAALLARQRVPVQDETGWKLSTTRSAASVMALLRAAAPAASTDELLDWLKALPSGLPGLPSHAVDALEQAVRRHACSRRDALAALKLEGAAAVARDWALQQLGSWPAGRPALADWLSALADRLKDCGLWEALEADAAGQQVLRALRLPAREGAWSALAAASTLRWNEFVGAVDEMLESSIFEPAAPAQPPAVIITPLRRALLRPFAGAVLPGADERRLGAAASPDPLLGEALSVTLGLPSSRQQQDEEALAFAHLLRLPRVVISWRHQEEGEALEPSLLVQRLQMLREVQGRPVPAAADPRVPVLLQARPQARPAPAPGDRLPARLSATAVEALRDCPYRFFARSILHLHEPEELDDDAEKRDYGNWLHSVLLAFHQARPGPREPQEDLAELRAIALQERDRAGLDDASFLPFEASFERFVGAYVEWLAKRDAEGARWLEGETERTVATPELAGTALHGRLDRVDSLPGGGRVRELLDYKTVPSETLRQRVKAPLEDTQLAFYAALELLRTDEAPPSGLKAAYLALDESDGVKRVEHPEVEADARVMLDHLAGELERIRRGAPLPALGEGSVCEHCEARGLCRRDHWTPDAGEAET